ncbi:MAG: hypothetical protein EA365_11505 [Gloeocapsa sp. DLM2.Bin57]|nr:MAG: hypothetical protein EA365_11505 [Gloeocapsa sp. DLM2.Bin57]
MDNSFSQQFDFSSTTNSSNQIGSALLQAQNQLEGFLTSSNASQQLDSIYDITDLTAKQELIENGLAQFDLPEVRILANEVMQGAFGAYSQVRNEIYIAKSLLESERDDLLLKDVLLEEMGHYLDTLLNPQGDSPGDEGELLKNIVNGNNLEPTELDRIRQENDWTQITVDNTSIWVEQDNTLSSARNLGNISGSAMNVNNGYVGRSDPNDYFRFYIDGTGSFSLSLTGMTADADVQLLNSSGSVIDRGTNGGSRSESISRTLSSGTYYVRVYSFGGANTRYNLSLRHNGTIYDAGNSMSYARDFGDVSRGATRNITNRIGRSDTNDYYRFYLTSTGTVSVGISRMSADADLELRSATGWIASSTRAGSAPDSISRTLSPGTYYARVYPHGSANTSYRLDLSVR